jgi:hypothetical protein
MGWWSTNVQLPTQEKSMLEKGDPWIYWLLIPVVGVVLLAGAPIVLLVHWMLKACGFRGGLFEQI